MICFNIYSQLLVRFCQHAIIFTNNNFWSAHREFVTFSAHCFDQDREVQNSPTVYIEFVLCIGFLCSHGGGQGSQTDGPDKGK